jgi:hypothetical protein
MEPEKKKGGRPVGSKSGDKIRREDFARKFLELNGLGAKAARAAGFGETDKSCAVAAARMLKDPAVQAMIDKFRAECADKLAITVDDLIGELEQARQLAQQVRNPSAQVAAVMGKAKLLGFDKAKVELTGADGGAIATSITVEFI